MRFDACAPTYDEHATPQHAFAALVAAFIKTRPQETVLELGAGTGALTRHLVETAGSRVHATDASRAMASRGEASVPQAQWAVLDAFADPLPPGSLQVSSGLLQWADDPATVLGAWRAALARDGRMVHAFPCLPCLGEWRTLVPESPVHWRDQGAWRLVFTGAGLQVRREEVWPLRVVFPSALAMVRALHLSGVTGAPRLGPGRLRQAIRAYDGRFREARGVYATWVWMAIEATA
jgi:SAM-dependent methyltransferase